jgi:serine/threonine-protein kinase
MIGKTVVHYHIVESIGRGGMGVVYKAEDVRLGRSVAIKFLPAEMAQSAEALDRFQREARSASSLNHPNICTVYDVGSYEGQSFIVMEYLQGETLKDRLLRGIPALDELLRLSIQITDALETAHSKGIVHRDVKPQNIFVTDTGQIKIMDFGLAKMSTSIVNESTVVETATVTKPGTLVGTIAYMSPEQARGEELDRRTDLFSFGVVLYEMATHSLPFAGSSPATLFDHILNKTPTAPTSANPNLPYGLELIIYRTLSKDRKDRYQTAAEIRADLTRLQAEPTLRTIRRHVPTQQSIAVLPFVNLTPDPDSEYFADGLTDDLINALSQVEGLHVVARTSAFRFKGAAQDVREIGLRLGVQTVLEGSVRQRGSRIRVATQLVSVLDGYQLWSERYDREVTDVFAIQDEISEAIVETLKIKLSSRRKIETYTNDIEAYNLYLKGLFHLNKRHPQSFTKAIELFSQAIQRDSQYAPAYSALSNAYALCAFHADASPKDVLPQAISAARRALEIDDSLASAHAAYGIAISTYDWNFVEAERAFLRAIELNPGYAPAHHWYGTNVLLPMGRLDDALRAARRASELDPLSLIINTSLASVLDFQGDYDAAIEMHKRTLELEPYFHFAWIFLGRAYEHKHDYEKAIEAYKKGCLYSGNAAIAKGRLGQAYANAGMRKEADEILRDLESQRSQHYVPANFIAQIYIGLGDKDRAYKWLDEAIEERGVWLLWLKPSAEFDLLRSDERYMDLLRKIGVAEGGERDARTTLRA